MFEEYDDYISASLIKQYHFCPRIVYFTEVLGVKERTTKSMEEGREEHERLTKLDLRRKTLFGDRKTRILNRWVRLEVLSERLKIRGVIDLVVETKDGLAIVEYKRAKPPKRRPPRNHVYQAAAYAMLAEEYFEKPVRTFYIHYDDGSTTKTFDFTLTENLRKHVLWTIRKIREIIEKEKLPNPENVKKCKNCGYLWICRGI